MTIGRCIVRHALTAIAVGVAVWVFSQIAHQTVGTGRAQEHHPRIHKAR